MTRGWARRLVLRMLEGQQGGQLTITLPGGERHEFGGAAGLRAQIDVHDERFFGRLVSEGNDGAGDSYVDGDWSSPDLVAVVRLAVRNLRSMESSAAAGSLATRALRRLLHLAKANTRRGARANIAAHYDLSNEFFALFLDRELLYSSAVWPRAGATLEEAQVEKVDRLCRRLQLGPQDHVLEIGSGWGGFALHAARNYGCRVTTTTISREQHAHCTARFAEAGEAGRRITLLERDYRDLTGAYDKIVSIEMFEAVGLRYYDAFFAACARLLRPEGLMAMQTITMNERRFPEYRRSSDWIQRRVFPGGELASLVEIQRSMARVTDFALADLEDIGMHYAETLAEWRRRFVAQRDEVARLGFDERFQRLWEYYLAYCEGAFRERYISAAQLVLAPAGTQSPLPNEPWGRREASPVQMGQTRQGTTR